jgi:hypothetical protein
VSTLSIVRKKLLQVDVSKKLMLKSAQSGLFNELSIYRTYQENSPFRTNYPFIHRFWITIVISFRDLTGAFHTVIED